MLNSSFDDEYKKKKIVKNNSARLSNNLEKTNEKRLNSRSKKSNTLDVGGVTNTGSSGGTLLG